MYGYGLYLRGRFEFLGFNDVDSVTIRDKYRVIIVTYRNDSAVSVHTIATNNRIEGHRIVLASES